MLESLEEDVAHRTFAIVLILLFFWRCVVFTRVHPRVAILYKTMVVMMEDFL